MICSWVNIFVDPGTTLLLVVSLVVSLVVTIGGCTNITVGANYICEALSLNLSAYNQQLITDILRGFFD